LLMVFDSSTLCTDSIFALGQYLYPSPLRHHFFTGPLCTPPSLMFTHVNVTVILLPHHSLRLFFFPIPKVFPPLPLRIFFCLPLVTTAFSFFPALNIGPLSPVRNSISYIPSVYQFFSFSPCHYFDLSPLFCPLFFPLPLLPFPLLTFPPCSISVLLLSCAVQTVTPTCLSLCYFSRNFFFVRPVLFFSVQPRSVCRELPPLFIARMNPIPQCYSSRLEFLPTSVLLRCFRLFSRPPFFYPPLHLPALFTCFPTFPPRCLFSFSPLYPQFVIPLTFSFRP